MVPLAAATRRRRISRYLGPAALLGVIAAIALVVASPPGAGPHTHAARPAPTHLRRIPPYWTVRRGDTYARIAAKTGLTVTQLEGFNPHTDPASLDPGQRLNLWAHPPAPRPKPLGPQFWTVRSGQSFGSIAAHTGISLATLEALNPRLKPTALQPGDRLRLHP